MTKLVMLWTMPTQDSRGDVEHFQVDTEDQREAVRSKLREQGLKHARVYEQPGSQALPRRTEEFVLVDPEATEPTLTITGALQQLGQAIAASGVIGAPIARVRVSQATMRMAARELKLATPETLKKITLKTPGGDLWLETVD